MKMTDSLRVYFINKGLSLNRSAIKQVRKFKHRNQCQILLLTHNDKRVRIGKSISTNCRKSSNVLSFYNGVFINSN